MLSTVGPDSWITAEERDVLAASATGRGVTEVAALIGSPPENVRRVCASAIAKLGARSKLEAVVIALRRGLITLAVI